MAESPISAQKFGPGATEAIRAIVEAELAPIRAELQQAQVTADTARAEAAEARVLATNAAAQASLAQTAASAAISH